MASKTYLEKLRDPRWQKKRLEILSRDNFACRFCANTQRTLNVHHCAYSDSGDPWDVPDKALLTLCEVCHQSEEDKKKQYQHEFLNAFGLMGATSGCYSEFTGLFLGLIKRYGDFAYAQLWHAVLELEDPGMHERLEQSVKENYGG